MRPGAPAVCSIFNGWICTGLHEVRILYRIWSDNWTFMTGTFSIERPLRSVCVLPPSAPPAGLTWGPLVTESAASSPHPAPALSVVKRTKSGEEKKKKGTYLMKISVKRRHARCSSHRVQIGGQFFDGRLQVVHSFEAILKETEGSNMLLFSVPLQPQQIKGEDIKISYLHCAWKYLMRFCSRSTPFLILISLTLRRYCNIL